MKLFAGFLGMATGIGIFLITWLAVYLNTKGTSFEFDAQGEKGAFEKLLVIYLDIAKFVLGLASASIVLLAGSSAFRSTPRLPESFRSPLFLLVLSVIFGILFMVLLIFDYEHYRHHPDIRSYTKLKYTRNEALGFGSLGCFCVGYVWLILIVTAP